MFVFPSSSLLVPTFLISRHHLASDGYEEDAVADDCLGFSDHWVDCVWVS